MIASESHLLLIGYDPKFDFTDECDDSTNSNECKDPYRSYQLFEKKTKEWTRLSGYIASYDFAIYHGQAFYIFYGGNSETYIDRLDTEMKFTQQMGHLKHKRRNFGVVSNGNAFFVFGGTNVCLEKNMFSERCTPYDIDVLTYEHKNGMKPSIGFERDFINCETLPDVVNVQNPILLKLTELDEKQDCTP